MLQPLVSFRPSSYSPFLFLLVQELLKAVSPLEISMALSDFLELQISSSPQDLERPLHWLFKNKKQEKLSQISYRQAVQVI